MPQHSTRNPIMDATYKVLMRRNSVYVFVILAGALAGERLVDFTLNSAWESNNRGKLYQHIAPSFPKSEGGEDEE